MNIKNVISDRIQNYIDNNPDFLAFVIDFTEGNGKFIYEKKITLRILDYFVSKYCCNKKKEILKIIYNDYKLHSLKECAPLYFYPFKKRERITYTNKNKIVTTTLAQINYLKWIHENNIIMYCINEYDNIIDQLNK